MDLLAKSLCLLQRVPLLQNPGAAPASLPKSNPGFASYRLCGPFQAWAAPGKDFSPTTISSALLGFPGCARFKRARIFIKSIGRVFHPLPKWGHASSHPICSWVCSEMEMYLPMQGNRVEGPPSSTLGNRFLNFFALPSSILCASFAVLTL